MEQGNYKWGGFLLRKILSPKTFFRTHPNTAKLLFFTDVASVHSLIRKFKLQVGGSFKKLLQLKCEMEGREREDRRGSTELKKALNICRL